MDMLELVHDCVVVLERNDLVSLQCSFGFYELYEAHHKCEGTLKE
jgi:hypothetical protein